MNTKKLSFARQCTLKINGSSRLLKRARSQSIKYDGSYMLLTFFFRIPISCDAELTNLTKHNKNHLFKKYVCASIVSYLFIPI